MQYKNVSIWSEALPKTPINKLNQDIDVDVLIVGGGLTGISTAYHLSDSKLKVAVVEKNIVGSGVSSRTTGKLTYLQEKMYSKIKSYHGEEKSKKYLESQKYAIDTVKEIIEKENIDCNFEKTSSYVITNKKDCDIDREIELLKNFGVSIKVTDTLPSIEKVEKSYYVEDTYVFHPIKYIQSLKNICEKKNVTVYEDTRVLSIDKQDDFYICETDNNTIKTKYVVLALHYPYFLIPFWISLKTHIEKSYIEAFEVEKNLKFSAINTDKPTISLRYHTDREKHYKLYLTNSHNTSVKKDDKKNFNELIYSKKEKPEYLWSNKDIMTNDSLPFIGSIDEDGTLLLGSGYNTWGMTNGSLAGKILADIILNKKNEFIFLFDPKRKMNIGKIINFPLIVGSNVLSFMSTKLIKNKAWYSKNVRFETKGGKSVGIYTDEDGKEHIVYNLCPHLRCSLIFNEIEKTWDCPCHGSRFDIDGNSIEGPSNYNITYKG